MLAQCRHIMQPSIRRVTVTLTLTFNLLNWKLEHRLGLLLPWATFTPILVSLRSPFLELEAPTDGRTCKTRNLLGLPLNDKQRWLVVAVNSIIVILSGLNAHYVHRFFSAFGGPHAKDLLVALLFASLTTLQIICISFLALHDAA